MTQVFALCVAMLTVLFFITLLETTRENTEALLAHAGAWIPGKRISPSAGSRYGRTVQNLLNSGRVLKMRVFEPGSSRKRPLPVARVTISMPQRTKDAVDYLAEEREESLSTTVKKFIAQGLALEVILSDGGKVYVEDAKGTVFLLPNLIDPETQFLKKAVSNGQKE